jgi:hypothetical protein
MKTRSGVSLLLCAVAASVFLRSGPSPLWAQQVRPWKSAADIAGTPAGTVMPRAYVETVGRLAYIWGWPLVNNVNRATAMEKLPEPGRIGGALPAAPPGYVGMLTDYIDEKERFVACPNQDTVYGAGFQHSIPSR